MYMDNKLEKKLDGKPERRIGDTVHILIEKIKEDNAIPFEIWEDESSIGRHSSTHPVESSTLPGLHVSP